MSFYKTITNTYITKNTVLRNGDKWMTVVPDFRDMTRPIEVRDLSWKFHDKPLFIQVKRQGVTWGGECNCNGCIFYCDGRMNSGHHCFKDHFDIPNCVQAFDSNRGELFIFRKCNSL